MRKCVQGLTVFPFMEDVGSWAVSETFFLSFLCCSGACPDATLCFNVLLTLDPNRNDSWNWRQSVAGRQWFPDRWKKRKKVLCRQHLERHEPIRMTENARKIPRTQLRGQSLVCFERDETKFWVKFVVHLDMSQRIAAWVSKKEEAILTGFVALLQWIYEHTAYNI